MIARKRSITFLTFLLYLALIPSAGATAIANGSIDFKNLVMTPASGTLSPDNPWSLAVFAHGDNSLGEIDEHFDSSTSPDSINTSAAVTWANAASTVSASDDPPDAKVSGTAGSNVAIPDCGPAFANATSQSTLTNSFTLSAPTNVQFSVDVSGLLTVMTDACGIAASTETIFNLLVDGSSALFFDLPLNIGPNDLQSQSFTTTLTNSLALDIGSHSLVIEADSESKGLVLPEPSAGALALIGLGALALCRRRRVDLCRRLKIYP